MNRKDRDFITLRFRKKLDDDLKEAVRSLEDGSLSEMVRDGLRLMLGIRTTKKMQVAETVLKIPTTPHEIQVIERHQADPQRSISSAIGKPLLNAGIKKRR